MEKQRGIKGLAVVALVVAVLGLTVAFAALSRQLTINGSATLDRANWDIHYAAASGADANKTKSTHSSSVTVTEGDIAATSVSGLQATLTKPGDTVTFFWDVVNAGDIDAHITALNPTTVSNAALTCTPVAEGGATQAEATTLCGDLVFTFKYVNGNAVATDDTLTVAEGTKHLELTLTYPSTVTNDHYPSGDVTVTFPTITTTYGQTLSN